jgi:histidinol dehydrogenase
MTGSKKIPIVRYPGETGKKLFDTITSARVQHENELTSVVSDILSHVRLNGDKALCDYSWKFDKVKLTPSTLQIPVKEIRAQAKKINSALKSAIDEAALRIEAFHRKQVRKGFTIKTAEGALGQLIRPLNRVGLYVPGGHTIYPSSVLMNVIPAQIAGVKEIVAITPPRKELDPGVAYALSLLNISEVYRVGGAQGIGALAYGTDTIRQVDKITGPGNNFVATAKKLVYGTVDIDSIAGPSEVVILADTSANPEWVALDLLAQAEHGSGDEIAMCITENMQHAHKIAAHLYEEIENSPVKELFYRLPEHALSVFVTGSRKTSISLVNAFAAEHLQIITETPQDDLEKVTNAAAVFIGSYTPVALGDYFIGTNHVLPTGGAARFASPLGVDSFQKRISVAQVKGPGLDKAAPFVSTFARAEHFVHHALSVERRT